MFEYNKEESVLSLREWILQESEFPTIATEAVHGLLCKSTKPPSRPTPRQGNQRTFFGEADSVRNLKKRPCLDLERIMAYGTVQHSIEEKWKIDGISLNIISYAFAV